MSSEPSSSENPGWTTAKSANGVDYEFCGPEKQTTEEVAPDDGLDAAPVAEALADNMLTANAFGGSKDHSSFSIDVDWRLGDGTYTKTDPDFRRRTKISQYAIHKNPGGVFHKYMLEFDVDNYVCYKYKFTDGEPDTYSKEAVQAGHYQLKYSSKDPNIKRVQGRYNDLDALFW